MEALLGKLRQQHKLEVEYAAAGTVGEGGESNSSPDADE